MILARTVPVGVCSSKPRASGDDPGGLEVRSPYHP